MSLKNAAQQVIGEIEPVMDAEHPGLVFVLSAL